MAKGDAQWILNPSGQRLSGEYIDDTLRLRAEEKGMTARLDRAAQFPRQRVEVIRAEDGYHEVNDLFYRRGWTDGLPVVPPTLERVDTIMRGTKRARNEVLGEFDPLKGLATVEKIAANAVMAGCRAEHLPVVLAAAEALADPEFNLRGVQTTDENVTPLLILSGPGTDALDVNDGFGALGPGWRGNATIGRAVRLLMNNLGGGWPAAVSFAGLGQPGRYSLCFAENVEQSPWESLSAELGYQSSDTTLTVMRAESVINVTGGIEEVASVMGSAASVFSIAHGGRVAVIIAPYTAARLAEDGYSKHDVKVYLHENGRLPVDTWRQLWIHRRGVEATKWPAWIRAAEATGKVPVVESPEHITIVVAGGDVPIAQQAYFPTWGFPDCRITSAL